MNVTADQSRPGTSPRAFRRCRGWWIITAALVAFPGAALTASWTIPVDAGTPWVQLLSIYPVTVASTLAAGLLAFLARGGGRTVTVYAVTILMIVQLFILVPRATPDGQVGRVFQAGASAAAPSRGLTVMSLNVGPGRVDVTALLAEVRTRRVDILAVPELNPRLLEELDASALGTMLPFRALDVDWTTAGSGLFARFPLQAQQRVAGSRFYQSRAVASIPGVPTGVALTAVHVVAPRPGDTGAWRTELHQLAGVREEVPQATPTIFLGDFNASLDHRELRQLLATGLTDSAAAAGQGLLPTWPVNARYPPFVALDHVLVSPEIAVSGFGTVRIPGTDHAAIVAVLQLPQ